MLVKKTFKGYKEEMDRTNFGETTKVMVAGMATAVDVVMDASLTVTCAYMRVALTPICLMDKAIEEIKRQTIRSYEEYVQKNGTQI